MDTTNYSGQQGLYVRVNTRHRPRLEFLNQLGSLVEKDLHITLMCSDRAPARSSLSELRSILSQPLDVQVTALAWISGHDGAGYLVAELKSEDAHDRHDLLTKIGCDPAWGEDSFYPHITLIKAITRTKAQALVGNINQRLMSKPVHLALTDTVCMDLR